MYLGFSTKVNQDLWDIIIIIEPDPMTNTQSETRKIAVASNKSKELKKEKKIKTIIQLDNLRCNVKQMNKMVSKVKQHQLMPILGGCGAGP